MPKINSRQRRFLNEILDKRVPIDNAIEIVGIDERLLCAWFATPAFLEELARRIEFITKRADMLISQHRLTAVEKLVTLTSCEKEETARKACLDIIELTTEKNTQQQTEPTPQLSPELAAKLLSIIADSKN